MRHLTLLVCASILAGCLGSSPSTDAPAAPPGTPGFDGPILERTGCTAINAFGSVADADLRPFVPGNWTFTTATAGRAILRMFVVTCADASTAMLSTPVVPDEASHAHHENPDHVIEVFSTDAAEAARWQALGIPASVATITRTLALPHDRVVVETAAGAALGLDLLPAAAPTTRGYAWEAVYSSGPGDRLVWFWGEEVSPSTQVTRPMSVTLGPASRLEGVAVQPGNAAHWTSFDLTYASGLPSG